MKTIHRHISADFLVTFVMTLLVFTFVMCIGVIFKANDLLSRGVAWWPVLRIIACGIPAILSFSIPISVMTSSLLVFGRLSSDGEITAMRACGISMWEIISRPALFALLLSALCLYINSELAPRSHFSSRNLKSLLGVESPLDILETGRFVRNFDGLTIYIGQKKNGVLENVRIYDTRSEVKTEIRAKTGEIRTDQNLTNIVLTLHDVRVDPIPGGEGSGFCDSYEVVVENAIQIDEYNKGIDDMMLGELVARIRKSALFFHDLPSYEFLQERMIYMVEFNKRFVLSVSCFMFVLLGVPLGIKAHRKESSIGVAMGLLLFFSFYLFVVVAENMAQRPEYSPELIIIAPVIISIFISLRLINRAN